MSPDELKARRRAATKEAKNSIPVVGIVVAVVVLGAVGVAVKTYMDQQLNKPPSVTLRYLAAQQSEDWATMKSLATRRSHPLIDNFSRLFKAPGNSEKITNFKALSFNVLKMEELEQKPPFNIDGQSVNKYALVTLTKAIPSKAQRLDDCYFILVPAGDTWKVDEVASLAKQSQMNGRYP